MTTLTKIASVGLLAGCLGLAFMTTPVHANNNSHNTVPNKLEQTLAKKDGKSTHSTKKKQHKKKRGGVCRPGMPCFQPNQGGGGCPGGNCPLPLDGDVGGY